MRRLKTAVSIAGILLLILSAASIYVALQSLSELRPAEDYEDQGVLTFNPYAEPKPRRWGWIAFLLLLLAALFVIVLWSIGHRANPPAAPEDITA